MHELKHTTAMLGLQGGMRINQVQKYLGHRSGASTLMYLRVDDGKASSAFARGNGWCLTPGALLGDQGGILTTRHRRGRFHVDNSLPEGILGPPAEPTILFPSGSPTAPAPVFGSVKFLHVHRVTAAGS